MLRTTPQSLDERLPLVSEGESFVVTADARIDNRKELISCLGPHRKRTDDIRDTDLILAAYQRWGDEAPGHLVGDFAFALWDGRRRTLLCARDPMGVKSFYYYHRADGLFAFASEIKALVACADIPCCLNELKVADHLLGNLEDTTSTFYQDIVRLPAAHSVVVGPESMRLRRYWELDCSRELQLRSDQEYAEAFREHFLDAVRARTRSAFPVGSALSGGLDSSSIACSANLVLTTEQRPLRTFSAVFPTLPEPELQRIDERPHVEAVLHEGQFDHTYVRADQTSPLIEWQRVFWHLDEACLAPNLYLHWGLYKTARAKGVRVFLDGVDGDTTVSHGFGHLTDLARMGRWLRFWKEATALSKRYPVSYGLRSLVRQHGIRALVPNPMIRSWRAIRSRIGQQARHHTFISQEFAESVGARGRGQRRDLESLGARRNHFEALHSPLIPYAMEIADKASAAFEIEARYPFLDRRLIEFCLSIPGEQKLHEGWTRMVMRRGMAGILPPEVQWRIDKSDLSGNFLRCLFEQDQQTIRHIVFNGSGRVHQYVDSAALRSMYQRWSAEPFKCQKDSLTLYSVATLALWLEGSKPCGRTRDIVSEKETFWGRSMATSNERT
jgi:asparagine synthase (glutamine-hydrolysing)